MFSGPLLLQTSTTVFPSWRTYGGIIPRLLLSYLISRQLLQIDAFEPLLQRRGILAGGLDLQEVTLRDHDPEGAVLPVVLEAGQSIDCDRLRVALRIGGVRIPRGGGAATLTPDPKEAAQRVAELLQPEKPVNVTVLVCMSARLMTTPSPRRSRVL